MRAWPLLLLVLSSSTAAAEEKVRIAIVDKANQITLAGHGLEVRELELGERYATAPGGRSVVYLSNGQMMRDGAPVKSADGVKFRSREFVRVAGEPVRGEIEVRRNGKGLIAINVLALEDYLAAVLGSEMPVSFPVEALKAQAVAARTYALQRKIDAWGKPVHMGATVLHQVYGGAKAEDPKTRQIVQETRGEVLVYRMEPVEAYFHSSCGGRTESGKAALGRDLAYLQPVDCPCRHRQPGWTLKVAPKQLASLLPDASEVRVVERTGTGRATRVQLASRRGRRVLSAVDLRRVLGYDKLKSLDFQVEKQGGTFVFKGSGFGHGAGLCQWGARVLAEQGWDYRRILSHYYVGSELRRMY